MDDALKTKLEAAAFRALQKHLMVERTDVQNIDLMNLAGFCRNCLSRWYQEAAMENGVELSKKKPAKFSMECRWKSGKQIIRPRQIKKNKKIFKVHLQRT